MNKEEAQDIAVTLDVCKYVLLDELLSFANACEKIGMEKAAKICDNQIQEYHCDGTPRRMEYVCAEEIRKGIE